MRAVAFLVCSCACLALAAAPFAYRKRETRIPMRDGALLYTAIYEPLAPGPHPILFERTPYGCAPYGTALPDPPSVRQETYGRDGYILVYQDVRGRFQSPGRFEHVRPIDPDPQGAATDESTDAWDSIAWLVRNVPGNNGRVGMVGISYPGFYAACGLVRAHPALKAVSPQAPLMDWFVGDDDHRNGALCLDMFEFYAGFFGPESNYPTTRTAPAYDFGTTDGYRFYLQMGPVKRLADLDVRGQSEFLRQLLAHPTYDAFWQARNLRPHLRDVRPAVLTVGGWYDGEDLFGSLECFKAIQRQSPGTDNHLVMGPWWHGQWSSGEGDRLGQAAWGQATARTYREEVEKPFFDRHLLGRAGPDLAKAFLFEVGTNRWRRFDAWPPPQARTRSFYFQARGGLATTRPEAASGFDEFVSDPAQPVPYTSKVCTYHPVTYLVEDQRFVAGRPDVLVYQSEPLAEDLTVAGQVGADLQVATSGTDSDWVVKLIDAHPAGEPEATSSRQRPGPGGRQELVRADVMRGKFRNSFERPEPFEPGRPTRVAWKLNDVLHTFRRGHRLMVQVQCSWFPLVDRNPQVFTDINRAGAEVFTKAVQRVFRDAGHPSHIDLPVLTSPAP